MKYKKYSQVEKIIGRDIKKYIPNTVKFIFEETSPTIVARNAILFSDSFSRKTGGKVVNLGEQRLYPDRYSSSLEPEPTVEFRSGGDTVGHFWKEYNVLKVHRLAIYLLPQMIENIKLEMNEVPFAPLTFGADQEYELMIDGTIVDAHDFIPSRSRLFGLDGNYDIAEVRTSTGFQSPAELIQAWRESLKEGQRILSNVNADEIKLLAGGGRVNPTGGHIHIGGITKSQAQSLIPLLDYLFARIVKSSVEGEVRKRSSYGKYGDVRSADWGVGIEYRVAPSFFFDPEMAELGIEMVKQITEKWLNLPWDWEYQFKGGLEDYILFVDEDIVAKFLSKLEYYSDYHRYNSDVFSNWKLPIKINNIVFKDDWSEDVKIAVRSELNEIDCNVILYGYSASRHMGEIVVNREGINDYIEHNDMIFPVVSMEIGDYLFSNNKIAIGFPYIVRNLSSLIPVVTKAVRRILENMKGGK